MQHFGLFQSILWPDRPRFSPLVLGNGKWEMGNVGVLRRHSGSVRDPL